MEQSPSTALIVSIILALGGATGLAAVLQAWTNRRNPYAQATGLMTQTYGEIVEDLRTELRAVRQDLDKVRDEVHECEQARQVTENELAATRLELAAVKSQLVELLEYPRDHDNPT